MLHRFPGLGIMVSMFLTAPINGADLANSKYDPKKPPVLNEPPLSNEGNAARLTSVKPDCAKEQVWTVQNPYKITVTATKDEKVPVPGNFDRVSGQLFVDKKSQAITRVEGSIDLLSFNSGVPDRDRRVQRYILQAEKNPLATFKATFPKNTTLPAKGSSILPLKSTLNFAGENFDFDLSMKAERVDGTSIRLTTVDPGTLNYYRDGMSSGLQKLLELCNHKFLAKAVKISMEMTLKSECPAN
jgi:polyisoprenoid-binding protein YceI